MPNVIVEQGKNFKRYENGTILIENVRASYPHVLIPNAGTDDAGNPTTPSYSITGIGGKKTHTEAKDACVKMIKELLLENKSKFKGLKAGAAPTLPADKKFVKNGDDSGKPENENAWTFNARENKRPSVRDKDKTPLTKDDAEKIYGGCYVNILIRPWFQDNKFGKRINANLVAVQFRSDGEPFGEGRMSEEDIDDVFDADDDDDDAGFDAGDDDDDL